MGKKIIAMRVEGYQLSNKARVFPNCERRDFLPTIATYGRFNAYVSTRWKYFYVMSVLHVLQTWKSNICAKHSGSELFKPKKKGYKILNMKTVS